MTSILIVEKGGDLKSLSVKEYQEDELFKKCGFKKVDGFSKQTEWTIKMSGSKYVVSAYGKTEGKANGENKYDFPPPIDNVLFFGSCALVCHKVEGGTTTICNLTLELWEKMYEKLFGGFEDLAATCAEDDAEIDELENVPKEKKTKQGYLKDGFVVDSSDTDNEDGGDDGSENEDDEDEYDDDDDDAAMGDNDLIVEDIGSELDEEEYDYSSDEA
jgi:hypothetical protein